MPMDLENKVALVTGGASGIGRAAALEFAELGARVVVSTGSNVEGGEETVSMIRAAGGDACFVKCDVGSEAEVSALVAAAVEKYGRLDCAFNNAGIGPDGVRIPFGPLTDVTEGNWDRIMNTNLKGVFFCLKHELIRMRKQGGGAIVNTASIGGLKMAPGFGAYGPSKSAVIALTELAALENARLGIRVNVVCPGPTVGTRLMDNNLASNPEEEALLKERVIPMGKLGTVVDVARSVVWLCSDYASHVTGQALSVDGGMHAQ